MPIMVQDGKQLPEMLISFLIDIFIYHQLKGEMSSQVMLPMPAGVEKVFEAESKLKER